MVLKEEYYNLLQKIKETQEKLKNYFTKQWKDFDTSRLYKLFAFVVNDQKIYIRWCFSRKNGIKIIYYVREFNKNKFTNLVK